MAALGLLAACSSGAPREREQPAVEPTAAAAPQPAGALAPQPAELGLEGEAAESFRILLAAERFTDAAIGDGGETPLEVRAWRRLDAHPRAAEAFGALADHATLGGRLYALCGLYYADPERFERELGGLAASSATLEYQSGCLIDGAQSVAELVRVEGGRVVRLERRDQTTKEWVRAHDPQGSYRLDIAGGGYPDLFRHGGGWYEPATEPLDERAGR